MNYLRILFLAFESFFKRVFKNVFQLTFLYIAYKYIFSQLADIRETIFFKSLHNISKRKKMWKLAF